MVSFSISNERLNIIDEFIKTSNYPDRSTFINAAIDFKIQNIKNKYLFEFLYLIGFPFLVFLISAGLALFFVSIIFFVVMGFSGLLLVISFFLFYNQYRSGKHS